MKQLCDYLHMQAGKKLCPVDKLDYAVSMSKPLIITGTRSHKTNVLRGDYTVLLKFGGGIVALTDLHDIQLLS